MKARQYLPVVLSPVLLASASNLNSLAHAQAAGEAPQNVLAAQIRLQGFACEKSLGAVQDRKRSKPDHPVWVLKCSNATYRVSRFPDMAAKVEPLR